MNQFSRSLIFRTKMATECGVCLEMFQDQTEFIPKLPSVQPHVMLPLFETADQGVTDSVS